MMQMIQPIASKTLRARLGLPLPAISTGKFDRLYPELSQRLVRLADLIQFPRNDIAEVDQLQDDLIGPVGFLGFLDLALALRKKVNDRGLYQPALSDIDNERDEGLLPMIVLYDGPPHEDAHEMDDSALLVLIESALQEISGRMQQHVGASIDRRLLARWRMNTSCCMKPVGWCPG
jgi:hypothetical protein